MWVVFAVIYNTQRRHGFNFRKISKYRISDKPILIVDDELWHERALLATTRRLYSNDFLLFVVSLMFAVANFKPTYTLHLYSREPDVLYVISHDAQSDAKLKVFQIFKHTHTQTHTYSNDKLQHRIDEGILHTHCHQQTNSRAIVGRVRMRKLPISVCERSWVFVFALVHTPDTMCVVVPRLRHHNSCAFRWRELLY